MKFKKLAVGLTVLISVNISTPTIQVFANEIKSNTSQLSSKQNLNSTMEAFELENHPDLQKYQQEFKIPNQSIINIETNGGHYSTSIPENALDNNPNTFWETGRRNSNEFKNEFIVEFDSIVNIDRVTYKARQSASQKGFLNQYEIYGSTSNSGDDFTLITEGTGTRTRDTMQIKFNDTQVKRVKIVFVDAYADWAAISELGFYKTDVVIDEMEKLFTDESKSCVSEKYTDINKINELEEIAKLHPFYEKEYKTSLADARVLIEEDITINPSLAQVKLFDHTNNKLYNDRFRVDNSNIKSIKNNAGNWSDKVIEDAIDGDLNTHWETNKGNNDTFKNEVEIEFNDRVILDKVVFGARQQDLKGFAEEFEIYVSNTSEGDTYKLLSTGVHSKTKGLIEAKFEATEFKRIKFRFKKSSSNWATLNEIWLYKEDSVSDEVNSIFTDDLYTILSTDYDTVSEINELEKKIINHPLEEELSKIVDLAKQIINGNEVEKSEVITLSQRGNENVIRNEKRQVFSGGNIDLTGYYVMPGESIEVYVDANKKDILPDLVFAQVGEVDNQDKGNKVKDLNVGRNVITAPEGTKGFAIYFANQALPSQQEYAPKVRIQGENLKKYPVYIHGKTDPNKYIEDVKNHTGANMTDVSGERFLISAQNTEAKIAYVDNNNSPLDLAREMENMIMLFDKISGHDPNHEDPTHRPSQSLYHLKLTDGGGLFAANSFTHLSAAAGREILAGEGVYGWGNLHEFGHQMESKDMGIGEVTNNIYSMTVQLEQGLPKVTKDTYDGVQKNMIDKFIMDGEGGYEDNHPSEFTYGGKLLVVYQIINYFGVESYTEAYKLLRENPGVYQRENREQTFICVMSQVIGYDLSPHFEYYNFPVSNETKEFTSKFKVLDKKIEYTMISAHDMKKDKVETFNNNTKAVINDIKTESDGFELSIDTNDNNKGTIIYEIFRDGKLVGISRENKFKDIVDTNKSYNYEVVAYDYRVNESIKSEVISSEIGFKPILNVDENVVLKLNDKFNPLEYVNPQMYNGESLDISKVKVIKNNVDTSKRGKYSVTYEVEDKNQTVTKDMDVEVVSEYSYLSDIDWVSATSGWGDVSKDTAVSSSKKIKLNVDGEIKEFDKGISAVANSEIVYNIEDKNYDKFSAYIGTDKNYNKSETSLRFKVIADGKEVYNSKLIESSSNSEFITIPLDGVKELKLVMDDNGDGITGDFGSWADAKFISNNTKPKLEVEDSITTIVGEPINDLVGSISAIDKEDGDITSNVVVNKPESINFNKPGSHKVTYTIIDSDKNTVKKERTIAVIDERDSKDLTDYEWTSAVQSYSTTKKDTNMNGSTLKLTGESGDEVAYERGIGAHANATIVYDLSDKDYEHFTSYVGVDRSMYSRGSSISFEAYVDGVKKFDSGIMGSTDPQKFIDINISEAKELKLVVKDGGNGIGQDHATFGNPTLYFANAQRADLKQLENIIKKAESISLSDYTQSSSNNLKLEISKAKELLKSNMITQTQCDTAIKNIETAINNLESLDKIIVIEDESLKRDIKNELGINTDEITLRDMHELVTLTCNSGYVTSLDGLENAVNLETLNIDYNEVADISAIKHLENIKNFSGRDNYRLNNMSNIIHQDGKIIINDNVIDSDGESIIPKKVILSPNDNPMELNLNDVLVGNKVVIDSELLNGHGSVEIIYESKHYNYQLSTLSLL